MNLEQIIKEAVLEALSYLGEDFQEANTMGFQEEKSAQEEKEIEKYVMEVLGEWASGAHDVWVNQRDLVPDKASSVDRVYSDPEYFGAYFGDYWHGRIPEDIFEAVRKRCLEML